MQDVTYIRRANLTLTESVVISINQETNTRICKKKVIQAVLIEEIRRILRIQAIKGKGITLPC